jgi:DNA-directed RNA polymerase specialized sigma24 family protein
MRHDRGLSAEGYHRLYDTVSERLLGFFVRRAPDPQTAVDLWAETWAVAYRQLARSGAVARSSAGRCAASASIG